MEVRDKMRMIKKRAIAILVSVSIILAGVLQSECDFDTVSADEAETVPASINNTTRAALARDIKEIPLLVENEAKQFLAFAYNAPSYENIDFADDRFFKLMTGDLENYNNNLEQLSADINALSIFVRKHTDYQISNSEKNTEYLTENLIKYLEYELGDLKGVDEQIFLQEKTKCVNRLKEGLMDIMSTQLAKHTGIVVTQNVFDNIDLAISSYNEITQVGEKIESFVNRICAGVQGFFLPLESEKVGRYTYFSSYLSNRGNYSTAENEIFQTIMEYNFLAAKENSFISETIDMTTWITGKDSWSNHRSEIDAWAEYLYQLEDYAKDLEKENLESAEPTVSPTLEPTVSPTVEPTVSPTVMPTTSPIDVNVIAKKIVSLQRKPTKVKWLGKKTGKRKIIVRWKKVKDAKGYQLQYAYHKKFKKSKKTYTKKSVFTIKKLKKKKTCYIRVRAYKMNGRKKVYGKWSAVKKVRIKK